jgi:hypothetical protein
MTFYFILATSKLYNRYFHLAIFDIRKIYFYEKGNYNNVIMNTMIGKVIFQPDVCRCVQRPILIASMIFMETVQ